MLAESFTRPDPAPTGSPEISVIVPAFRGRATILACLGAVQREVIGWNHEILVVESSGDGTVELVEEHFPQVRLIISRVRLTAGQARNLGIRAAFGRWLFCVDQDCLVPSGWISRLLHHLDQPGVGAAGGSMEVANPAIASGWCVYFLEFLNHFPSRVARVSQRNFLIGANSAWRADMFDQLAFPDQTLGEDLLLSEAVRQQGLAVIYDPTIAVRHYNREGWAEFRRYARAMGRAAAHDQRQIGGHRYQLIERWPMLSFGVPLVILPLIGWRLLNAPPTYLLRFLLLLPCCLLGQLLWAWEFRAAVLVNRGAAITAW